MSTAIKFLIYDLLNIVEKNEYELSFDDVFSMIENETLISWVKENAENPTINGLSLDLINDLSQKIKDIPEFTLYYCHKKYGDYNKPLTYLIALLADKLE